MKHSKLVSMLVIFAAAIGAILMSSGTAAAQPPPYNPYPPGILPSDLVSEIARVRREVASIEAQALAQWRALPPPTLTGQPPTLQGTGYSAVQILGKLMNFDEN